MQPCPSYHLLMVSQYAITNVNLIGQTQPKSRMTPFDERNTRPHMNPVKEAIDSSEPTNNSCNEYFFSSESFKQPKKPQWKTKSLTIQKAVRKYCNENCFHYSYEPTQRSYNNVRLQQNLAMNSPCTLCTWHRKTRLINEKPHAIYDSKTLAKANRFWSTKTSRNT